MKPCCILSREAACAESIQTFSCCALNGLGAVILMLIPFTGYNRRAYTPTFALCTLPDQLPVEKEETQAFEYQLGLDAFKAFFGM